MSEPTPRWTRAVTRPTRAEVDALTPTLDPAVAAFARDATRPTPAEVASIRPRVRRSYAALFPTTLAVATAALVLGLSEPALFVGSVRDGRVLEDDQAWVYVVTPDQELRVFGVQVRGTGTVRERPGGLAVTGDLDLVVHAPVVLTVAGIDYRVEESLVHVDQAVVVVEPFPVAVLETEPPPPVPLPLPVAVPLPAAPVRLHPRAVVAPQAAPEGIGAPSDPVEVAWREVLTALEERRGTAEERAEQLRSFSEQWPRSRFAGEAGALAVLVLGVDGAPAERLAQLEGWLAANPGGPRSLEIEALAARVAREKLADCGRARPHDEVLAKRGSAVAREKAKAYLGLCARAEGRVEEGDRWLATVDPSALDPALRSAVQTARRAREEGP